MVKKMDNTFEEENIIKTNLSFDFSNINLDEMAEKFQNNILLIL